MGSSSRRPVWVFAFLSLQLTCDSWNLRNLPVNLFPVFSPVISAVMNYHVLLMRHFVKTLHKGFGSVYLHSAVFMRLNSHAQSERESSLEEFEK